MTLPFTIDAFFDVFARYNRAVWPARIDVAVTPTRAVSTHVLNGCCVANALVAFRLDVEGASAPQALVVAAACNGTWLALTPLTHVTARSRSDFAQFGLKSAERTGSSARGVDGCRRAAESFALCRFEQRRVGGGAPWTGHVCLALGWRFSSRHFAPSGRGVRSVPGRAEIRQLATQRWDRTRSHGAQ